MWITTKVSGTCKFCGALTKTLDKGSRTFCCGRRACLDAFHETFSVVKELKKHQSFIASNLGLTVPKRGSFLNKLGWLIAIALLLLMLRILAVYFTQ